MESKLASDAQTLLPILDALGDRGRSDLLGQAREEKAGKMRLPGGRGWWLLLVAFLLFALPLPLMAQSMPKLSAPPEGERWFSISMGDERVGFAHLRITREGEGYRIQSDSGAKLHGIGFSRDSASRQSYLVRQDLSLVSFAGDYRTDGKPLSVKGEVAAKGIVMAVDAAGEKKDRTIKWKAGAPLYPPDVLNMLPLMRGTLKGKSLKVPMLDLESLKVKQVKIEVIGQETLPPSTQTVHLRNDLYPIVDNDIWVDLAGNTVKESVRDDLILTQAEDAATARQQLVQDAVAKKDTVLSFSQLPVTPIERPEQLKKLVVEAKGLPEALPLLQGKAQQAVRQAGGSVLFTMPNAAFAAPTAEAASKLSDLASSAGLTSDAPEIVAKKDQILAGEKEPANQARLLLAWVSKEIKENGSGSLMAVDTLKKGEGSSQGHARLYAALARAAGVPTGVVAGLVYLPGKGFLYHCWAESLLDGWQPVDPTYGEFPADLTHIKLVEGDAAENWAPLADVIGKLQVKVVDKQY